MKLNRKLVLVLTLVLSVAMATTGTLAYLTDRDSAKNEFTLGNVTIDLIEDKFDANNDNVLLPGVTIEKEPYVKNTGSVDAYTWVTVAMPAGAFPGSVTIEDMGSDWMMVDSVQGYVNEQLCDIYTYKYDEILEAGQETSKLFTAISMNSKVDITPDGDFYMVENGVTTFLNFNLNDAKDGKLPVYVSAYAVQAEGFENFADAYDAYYTQWGSNGTEWGETSFTPSESLTEKDNVVYINNASDLFAFANAVNSGTSSYSGKTVKLTEDIDLKNAVWTPIGAVHNTYFRGTFDGDGHTIKNLNVDMSNVSTGYTTAGLFGWVDAAGCTIKNLTIDGATVKGSHYTGAVVGYLSGTLENCHVKNATIISKHLDEHDCGDKAGTVVGYLNKNTTVKYCSATNCTVTAARDAGQVVGCVYGSGNAISNCWATNVTVEADVTGCTDSNKGGNIKNEIIGRNNGITVDNDNLVTISTKDQLFTFAEAVNSGNDYSGKTVVLTADIDLLNAAWTPIGQSHADFAGTFDGNGHTIKNLKVTQSSSAGQYNSVGLFGWLNGAVKNLTIDGATITGYHNVGAIAGYVEDAHIEGCAVKNATISASHLSDDLCGDKVGGVAGIIGHVNGTIKNCSVSNSTITASRDAGQVLGCLSGGTIEDCTATNVTVSRDTTTTCTDSGAGTNIKNELVGR